MLGRVDPKQATEIPETGGRSLDSQSAGSRVTNLSLMLERSARLSQRLADRAARPRRRKGQPLASDLACGLYRQSAYYSLRALSLLPREASAEAPLQAPAREGGDPFTFVFQAAPAALLANAAGGAERAEALEQRLRASTFVDFAALEPVEANALTQELSAFARALLAELEVRQRRFEREAASRSLSVLALAALTAIVAGALLVVPELWQARRDLALGKPWVASSTWGGGCDSPLQDCPGDGTYFIHTQTENEPWLEFDLQSSKTISGAQVINRTDCCIERIVPLVLEVSTDHKQWREVVRSTQPFREWKPSFSPVSARWVRLRIPKYGLLHLKRVRIFP